MQVPKIESGLHNLVFVRVAAVWMHFSLPGGKWKTHVPGEMEACFSWRWTGPKPLIQFPLQIWSMQCPVSVFHIISVWWCVVFTMKGTSWREMEAQLLATTLNALAFPTRLSFITLSVLDCYDDVHSKCEGCLPPKKEPSRNRRNQRIDVC